MGQTRRPISRAQGASGNWDVIRGGWPKVVEIRVGLSMWEELSMPEQVMSEMDGRYVRIRGT